MTEAVDTRGRLLDTALGLYAEHGVEGTSLQRIADALGVTKAAVYYYFKTKDEIAHAVIEPGLRDLRVAVTAAEAQRRHGARVDTMLDGLVDVIIRHRTLVRLFNGDPGLQRIVEASVREYGGVAERVIAVLTGAEPTPEARVAAFVAVLGMSGTGGAPEVADLDDDQLRAALLDAGGRALGRPRRR
ncbi:MAG: TetR family transcriptional regulator [Actinophytocola sp.]|nr:TetR family transcriptional regulator [Actinophytocola sp.]